MKLNKTMKKILAVVMSIALVVASITASPTAVKADGVIVFGTATDNGNGTFTVPITAEGAAYVEYYLQDAEGGLHNAKSSNAWVWNTAPDYQPYMQADNVVGSDDGAIDVAAGGTFTLVCKVYSSKEVVDETTLLDTASIDIEVAEYVVTNTTLNLTVDDATKGNLSNDGPRFYWDAVSGVANYKFQAVKADGTLIREWTKDAYTLEHYYRGSDVTAESAGDLTYNVVLTAVDADGNTIATETIENIYAYSPVNTDASLAATVTPTSATLAWKTITDAASYVVYVNDEEVATVTSTTYTMDIDSATTYNVVVKALDADGAEITITNNTVEAKYVAEDAPDEHDNADFSAATWTNLDADGTYAINSDHTLAAGPWGSIYAPHSTCGYHEQRDKCILGDATAYVFQKSNVTNVWVNGVKYGNPSIAFNNQGDCCELSMDVMNEGINIVTLVSSDGTLYTFAIKVQGEETPVDPPVDPETTEAPTDPVDPETTTDPDAPVAEPIEVIGQLIQAQDGAKVTFTWGQNAEQIALGQTYNVYIDGEIYQSNVGPQSLTYKFATAGEHTIKITAVLGDKETEGVTLNVTVAGETPSESETKLTPEYKVPTGLTAEYGQTLGDVKLDEGFTWNNENQSVGSVGTNKFKVTYTPEDTEKYEVVKDIEVSIIVTKAENIWTEDLLIDGWTYGESKNTPSAKSKFGDVKFTYSDSENGEYSESVPTTAGTWYVKAYVEGTNDYTELGETKSFEIKKAVPEYTVPTNLTAKYGETLNDVELAKGFTWEDETLSVGNVGTNIFMAKYTPADTVNYEVIKNIPVSIAVSQVTNEWTKELSIEGWPYGETGNTPSAEAKFGNVKFTYSNSETGEYTETVPTTAGTWYVKAYVEGTDDYTELSKIKSFKIKKAVPAYTVPTNLTAKEGQTLKDVTLPEGFEWEDETLSVGNVGTNIFIAKYTPADTVNYEVIKNIEVSVTVEEEPTTVKNTFTVKFDYNGGSGSEASVTVTKGKKYGSLPTAKRRKYLFDGWYTEKSDGTKVTAENVVNLDADQTLYAHWTKVVVSPKIKLSACKQRKGKITIKVRKAKLATGFVIYCSNNKKFKKAKKINVVGKKKKTFKVKKIIKKAKTGKTYYYRIRPYVLDSTGKKVWGKKSKIRAIMYSLK